MKITFVLELLDSKIAEKIPLNSSTLLFAVEMSKAAVIFSQYFFSIMFPTAVL
jgi:hypothetical protein